MVTREFKFRFGEMRPIKPIFDPDENVPMDYHYREYVVYHTDEKEARRIAEHQHDMWVNGEKMATKDETEITQAILKHLSENLGGDGYHVHGSAAQRGGEPDITGEVYLQGLGWIHLKVEVKTSGGVPSKRQLYRLKRYWEHGYLVGVVVSVHQFHDLVYAYMAYRQAGNPGYTMADLISGWNEYPEIYDGRHNQ